MCIVFLVYALLKGVMLRFFFPGRKFYAVLQADFMLERGEHFKTESQKGQISFSISVTC